MATAQRPRSPRPRQRSSPVTVRQLPLVRCSLCDRALAYQPGNVTDVLTTHYQREHPDAPQP